MKTIGIVFFLSVFLCLVATVTGALAQSFVPMLVNYQGDVRSPETGEPLPDGTWEMLFRIYDVEFGGTPLWVGTHSSLNGNPVEVTGGIFHVILGSGTGNSMDSSVFNGPDRWVEIRIGMETLEPRQRITSVAYSMVAENSRLLDGQEASEFAPAAHAHSGTDITSGTIAEGRIDAAMARDSEILPAVLAADGAGSTLDADLLDGRDSAEFAPAAHTHSGNDITSGSVAEGRIDAGVARDTEVDSKIGDHAAIADAHHSKTTSFTELTDVATNSQIPGSIARDSEIMPTVLASDGTGSGLDADTVDGADAATLEESAEIDTDISAHAAVTDAHHTRYADAEAVAAMGAKADTNPLNHDKTASLPWGSITSIPAGFADDTDDDTTYSPGSGLDLAGTTFSARFAGSGAANTVARSDHNHDSAYVNEAQSDSVTSSMIVDGNITSTDLEDSAVITGKINNLAVTTGKIANSAVTTEKIANGTIEDADVSSAAGIAGTKIDPDFGSQDIVTRGRIGAGTSSPSSRLQVSNGTLSVYYDGGVAAGEHELARFERDELTGYPGVRLGYVADGTGVTGAFVREGGVGGDLELGTGGYPQAMIIRNSGNVGIGTTSPSAKLEVVSSAGQDSVQLNQGEVRTDNVAASTSRYVVSIGGAGYWGVGKTHTGNNNFHIINYPSSRWDLTVRNDTGNVGVGTTSPQEKLDVNGNARVAGDLTVVGNATLGGVSMGKIYLTGSGTILSTDGGTRVLYWDAVNDEIELTNTSGDYLDYWWQAQKGTTTSGDANSLATGNSNHAIITEIGSTNCYACEVHFGQADGQEGWCSVWLQYANNRLVGHYIKY